MMQNRQDERTLGELFGDLVRDMGTLFKQELRLATTEMTNKASRFGKDAAFIAVGGLVAYAGLLAIIAAVIVGLAAAGIPWWLSALLVGLVIAGLGYGLVQKGISSMKREGLVPHETIDSLKEDAQWAKEQIR